MGHKIRPTAIRIGIIENWHSRGMSKKGMISRLEQDELIRGVIKKRIGQAGIDKIDIERTNNVCRVVIHAARPGLIIGRGGKGIEELHAFLVKQLEKLERKKLTRNTTIKKEKLNLAISVEELKKNDVSAMVIAQSIASDLERRTSTRQAMRKYLDTIMQYREVRGVKLLLSGRLDGAEIARNARLMKGVLPLQTLRARIDYGEATAFTIYGTVGIKVWIYKGEVFIEK